MSNVKIKFSNLSNFYKIFYKLVSSISAGKSFYIILFFLLMIFSAFFEISLLGFLFVLLKAFMDPSYFQGNFFFKFILKIFNINSNQELVSYFSVFFIITCLIAGFFRTFFLYILSKYVYFFSTQITNSCYQKIIYQDYKNIFSINNNESLSIFQKMPIVVNSFYNTLYMIYNLNIFIFIILILGYINFKITSIVILFFLVIYFVIVSVLKKKIYINGNTISNEQSTNIKVTRETFNGFRDILINNYQNFYNNLFSRSFSKLTRGNEENRFFNQVPKPMIETFVLAGIGFIISINSNNYGSLEKLLPNIAVLAIASQRILPILNQLYQGLINNLDAEPAANFILNYTNKQIFMANKKNIKPIKFNDKISINNVSFNYTNKIKNSILKNINIEIFSGSRIGIIGKSGSGKSTLTDLILGLLDPNSGNILVDGQDIKNKKQGWFLNVASVPQNIFITDQTIMENVAFGVEKKKINLKEVKVACKKAEIDSWINLKDKKYNDVIGEKGSKISIGQKQRLAIARALYKKSKLIIFDEATSSLDTESEKEILKTIYTLSRKKYTIILISHKLSNLNKCDHIYKVSKSNIIKVR